MLIFKVRTSSKFSKIASDLVSVQTESGNLQIQPDTASGTATWLNTVSYDVSICMYCIIFSLFFFIFFILPLLLFYFFLCYFLFSNILSSPYLVLYIFLTSLRLNSSDSFVDVRPQSVILQQLVRQIKLPETRKDTVLLKGTVAREKLFN